jgi:hypothetical protein
MDKTTIYATAQDSVHTLQRMIDDAITAKWRRETQPTHKTALLLDGATIYHIHTRGDEPCQ